LENSEEISEKYLRKLHFITTFAWLHKGCEKVIETILLTLVLAKVKGYKLKPLFKSWAVYPVIGFQLIYLLLQVTVFMNNYTFIKYTGIFKTLYLCSFLFLIIKYKRYVSAFIGSLFIFLGSACNNIAISANADKMPVFPTLSYVTGYADSVKFVKADNLHILGSSSTKLKFLTDIIDTGYCIMSIGDIFIRVFIVIVIFSTIKHINKRENAEI